MRIALLTHDIPGASTSGVGSYTLHCAAALARTGEHEPHIFTFGATPETYRLLPRGVQLHSLPGLAQQITDGKIGHDAAAILGNAGFVGQLFAHGELLCEALRQHHQKSPFDIVEAPDVCFPGLSLLIRPIPGLPIVTMLHAGTAISRHFNEVPPTQDDLLLIALEFAAITLADALCAPTRSVVETTRRFLPFTQNVDLFPSPIPCSELMTPSAHADPHTQTYVMFAGRIDRLKGCCELALAANVFLKACPDAELRLYGPDVPMPFPPTDPRLNTTTNAEKIPPGASSQQWMLSRLEPGIRSRVRFMGPTSPTKMPDAYAGCRFVVAPSRFENFGTAAAEALVAGRPVLYSAGTGLEETVADAGLPFRHEDPEHLAEQMIRLWNDAPLRQSLVARGINRLKHELSPALAVDRRLSFYRKTIAQMQNASTRTADRLGALPPAGVHAILQYASGLSGRLAGIASAKSLSPGVRAAQILQNHRQNGNPLSSLWIYGGGKHTRRLLVERDVIQKTGARICGIIDDAARPDETLYDLPVITRSTAEARHHNKTMAIDALLLSSDSLEETLWTNAETFRRRNVPVLRLYS